MQLWLDASFGLFPRLASVLSARGAHTARTVVLLPYAQLLPVAARAWAHFAPDGFAPRFETTRNWLSVFQAQQASPIDISYDAALDRLTAQAMLVKAGLSDQADLLTSMLVEKAQQLGGLASAVPPEKRSHWANQARVDVCLGMDGSALRLEMMVSRIAVEWACASRYVTDVLYEQSARSDVDCLVMIQGYSPEPLEVGLTEVWGEKFATLSLVSAHHNNTSPFSPLPSTSLAVTSDSLATSSISFHTCLDAEDEAQRSAACLLRHIEAGRLPVALVSSDRLMTRRIRAMLDGIGVQIRDETGWKLSTARAAADVMALLRMGKWNASSDEVVALVKVAPAWVPDADALEAFLRKRQLGAWRDVGVAIANIDEPQLLAVVEKIEAVRAQLKGLRKLVQWLAVLQEMLVLTGQWEGLCLDGAGAKLLEVLRLQGHDRVSWTEFHTHALWAQKRFDLSELTEWVNQALEAASFQPQYPINEEVVILPMNQLLARPFAAVVLAGCDEVRLSPSPELTGGWTAAQRTALGMTTREDAQSAIRAGWLQALRNPYCDVLWRTSDEAGEPLLPSPLVELLLHQRTMSGGDSCEAFDPRVERAVPTNSQVAPQPVGAALPVEYLSASAYEDLRTCPYRFFALRMLDLKSVDELDAEVDKRDFGLWLHEVLKCFHEALAAAGDVSVERRLELLESASQHVSQSMALAPGEFLPFAAAWPAVRDGYLTWLDKHVGAGNRFERAEVAMSQPVGSVRLRGRIDRIDRAGDGSVMVLDYKTETQGKTSARVKTPLEDTQVAFYAALLSDDTLQGGYVNVNERDGTRLYAQPDLVEVRDALIGGIVDDMARIAGGQVLPALGDGVSCDFCSARGMCRKDFWDIEACS